MTTPKAFKGPLYSVIDPEIVLADICSAHNVTLRFVRSYRRNKHLVTARKACVKALRDLGLSMPAIGKLLHRDHTTVLHHLRSVKT